MCLISAFIGGTFWIRKSLLVPFEEVLHICFKVILLKGAFSSSTSECMLCVFHELMKVAVSLRWTKMLLKMEKKKKEKRTLEWFLGSA